MRLHYKIYPTEYIEELMQVGKRMKARCFMEYWHDVQTRHINSIGFYAKSWGTSEKPLSKGTVHKWIMEFAGEINRFNNSHYLTDKGHNDTVLEQKNTASDSSAKKQSERQVNGKRTNERQQTPTAPSVDKTEETASERQVNKELNINDDDKGDASLKKRLFGDLYMIYRLNTKFAGTKEEAYAEYMKLNSSISHKELVTAIILYLHDYSVSKKYNLTNFLKNEIYLNYMDKRIKVLVDGEWITGSYDSEREILTADSGTPYQLTPVRLAEKLAAEELHFIIGDAA